MLRKAAEKLKLAAFAMITAGLLGLFIFASNLPKPDAPASVPTKIDNSERKSGTSEAQTEQVTKEKTALENQAATKLAEGERLYFAGRND